MLKIESIEDASIETAKKQTKETATLTLPYIQMWNQGREATKPTAKKKKRHLKKHIREKLDFACTLLILVQMTFWVWIVLAIF